MLLRYKTRFVYSTLAICCVLVAATGCSLHRAGHSCVLRGQWSLECGDGGCLQPSGVFGQCENCSDCTVCPADQTKPEVLPWRARLKTRIGDRLFHRGECGATECCDEAACVKSGHPMQPAPLPAAPPTPPDKPIANLPDSPTANPPDKSIANPPDKPIVPEKSPPTVKTTDLEVPASDLSTPELNRPDIVLE